MSYGAITVPATTNGIQIVAANKRRTELRVFNNGSATIFLAENNSLTTSTGYPLASGKERVWKMEGAAWPDRDALLYTGAVFGIVASSTVDLRYWETDDTGAI